MGVFESAFYVYGKFVARHPWPFLITPMVITVIAAFGALNFSVVNDIWDLYMPDDSLSRAVIKMNKPFVLISSHGYYAVQVLAEKKQGSNNNSLLTESYIQELLDFNEHIEQNLTYKDPKSQKPYKYSGICGAFCDHQSVHAKNRPLLKTLQMWIRNPVDSNLIFTYPKATVLRAETVFLGYSLGRLKFNERSRIVDFGLYILHYHVYEQFGEEFENMIQEELKKFNAASQDIELYIYSPISDVAGQNDVMFTVMPVIPVTAFILFLWAFVTLFRLPFSQSQHLEGFCGIVGPTMATITTFGCLFALGYEYNNVLCVIPFLILVIGLDDGFLLLTGWRSTKLSDPVDVRIGETTSKSGTSVTITSLTDVLCFVAGSYSIMPTVRFFSIFTAVALTLDYIYQLTFFVAFMTLCGHRQHRALNGNRLHQTPRYQSNCLQRITQMLVPSKLKMRPASTSALQFVQVNKQSEMSSGTASTCSDDVINIKIRSVSLEPQFRVLLYAIFHNPKYRLLGTTTTFILYLIYVVFSVYLTATGIVYFSLSSLYTDSHRMFKTTSMIEQHAFNDANVVNFIVPRYPDFENATVRAEFLEMISEFESIPQYSMGPEGTRLWVREYEQMVGFFGDRPQFWAPAEILREPMLFPRSWLITENATDIKAFWFTITYHNMGNILNATTLYLTRLDIQKAYPQFEVHSSNQFDMIVDIELDCPDKLMQTTGAAVILMAVLVLIFVRDIEASFWVINSLFMMTAAVIGFAQLWGVYLDGISMLSILLSVGVSVDYTAHVCYHFYTHPNLKQLRSAHAWKMSRDEFVNLRVDLLLDTFIHAGWPIVQGSVGNCLGMMPLVFITAYIVEVFWKTVFLVAVAAWFYSMLFLPFAFISFMKSSPARPIKKWRWKRNKVTIANDVDMSSLRDVDISNDVIKPVDVTISSVDHF